MPEGWMLAAASALRLVGGRRRRSLLVLRHELVELFLVLRVAQAVQEFAELGLLVLETPQGFHAVFVEGAVPAGGRSEAEAEPAPLHAAAHPVHLPLHAFHLARPAILMTPATHFSAPECEKEKGEADRPPDDEAQDGHGNPAGMPGAVQHMWPIGFVVAAAPSIDICGVGHFPLHDGFTPL